MKATVSVEIIDGPLELKGLIEICTELQDTFGESFIIAGGLDTSKIEYKRFLFKNKK